jgi:hypothetical protein
MAQKTTIGSNKKKQKGLFHFRYSLQQTAGKGTF